MNDDSLPPADDSLHHFLQSQAAAGPGHAARERERRKLEQAEVNRRRFHKRLRAVVVVSSGAAVGVMGVGVVTGRNSLELANEVLLVLFVGPFVGLVFAMGAMYSAVRSDVESAAAGQMLKRTENDSSLPDGPWRASRFLVFAGPVVMSWVATDGHAPSFQAGLLGAIGTAGSWYVYNRRYGETAPSS